jgi:hypothetical protein
MVGPSETEYAVGVAMMAGQVDRRDRRAVRSVLAKFESRRAIDRSKSEGRSGNKTENEALQNKGVNDHNAGQSAPNATPRRASLLWLRAHERKALRLLGPTFKPLILTCLHLLPTPPDFQARVVSQFPLGGLPGVAAAVIDRPQRKGDRREVRPACVN